MKIEFSYRFEEEDVGSHVKLHLDSPHRNKVTHMISPNPDQVIIPYTGVPGWQEVFMACLGIPIENIHYLRTAIRNRQILQWD